MASNGSSIPTIHCAEDIALVHLLQPVMNPPFDNPTSSALVQRKGYTLPFDREKRLASTLAFLSSTKDDPDHVPALCIAENTESESLNVLLAVNKINPEDGNQALQNLARHFEGIFSELSRLHDSSPTIQKNVFTAIIAMCHDRILCRLGFIATNRRITRPSIKTILQDTVRSLSLIKSQKHKTHIPFSRVFVQKAKEVIQMADKWEKHQTLVRLEDLVACIHQLCRLEGIQSILAAIPSTYMNPNLTRRLLNIITKVSRYKEASRFLYRTAKRYQRARHMRPIIAVLPTEAYEQCGVSRYDPNLLDTLSRFRGRHAQRDLQQVCSLLKIKQQDAKNQFAQRAKRTVMEARIHAEIQLIYYNEIVLSTLPPRVVCSSKDACYLCNYFILMHQKMHTPRCHGKIYTGWRLPTLPALQDLGKKFNIMLDSLVETNLDNILIKRKKITYPDPNESTLLSLAPSISTASIIARPIERKTSTAPTLVVEDARAKNSWLRSSPEQETMLPEDPEAPGTIAACPPISLLSQSRAESWAFGDASTSTANSDNHHIKLAQGHLVPGRTKIGALPRFYSVGPLELIIEHFAKPTEEGPGESRNKISYGIEWLDSSESMRRLEALTIVDAESLEGDVTYKVERAFFIAGWGSLVKISIF